MATISKGVLGLPQKTSTRQITPKSMGNLPVNYLTTLTKLSLSSKNKSTEETTCLVRTLEPADDK